MSEVIPTALALFCAAAVPAVADAPPACGPCARGCELVMGHGGERGGGIDLAAVLDLNMRGWKPQSSRGIEILGWSADRLTPQRCAVSYTYREGGEIVIRWEVDLATGAITPLSALAERMQRMSEVLSSAGTTKTAAERRRAEQPKPHDQESE